MLLHVLEFCANAIRKVVKIERHSITTPKVMVIFTFTQVRAYLLCFNKRRVFLVCRMRL